VGAPVVGLKRLISPKGLWWIAISAVHARKGDTHKKTKWWNLAHYIEHGHSTIFKI